MIWILNYVKENIWDYFFNNSNDGIKYIYLVSKNGKKVLTSVNELKKPHDHVEIEFVFENKTYIHVLSGFHRIHEPPIILSAVLNDVFDITEHVSKYLTNDLSYLQVKHVIPQKYMMIFEKLEILDNDCNSLVYRKLETCLDFLDTPVVERTNSR